MQKLFIRSKTKNEKPYHLLIKEDSYLYTSWK